MKLLPWEPDLKTVIDRVDNDDIDLQPNFQRQEVWQTPKKKKLIDTILRGWSIPAIFLVVKDDGSMDVLDGQQRLAAIRDFIHNKISIDGTINPVDPDISGMDRKFYKDLDSSTRRKIDQHTLRCFRITDYRPDEPSELFYRLNQPSMLTAGEQRNAFYGPAREQLKSLVDLFIQRGARKETIGFSNIRLAYDDVIARLLFFIERRSFSIKITEVLVSQRFKAKDAFSSDVYERAMTAVDMFSLSLEYAGNLRLNKASTLSWLLFFTRLGDSTSHYDFMQVFSYHLARSDAVAHPALSVFQDRSSLRVTDVTSVVFRDAALWTYFTFDTKHSAPVSIPVADLRNVVDDMTHGGLSFEEALAASLDIERWSAIR